ncbi:M48 family metallopeptidase [Leptospira sp. 201903070]|uniref:M48 family metallopeptidase n=1 Tax=Leptospira ainlahdjerensis TaxID=2810033 RepID=A0ABS2UB68_9LEPT|nr:YgjP-like metallopeptidase domain-containing protein [Leptospira ainlahdjerensis]MBM9577198.1 M48 family metallopeptidase [Leptospira ainlahdjerensis]
MILAYEKQKSKTTSDKIQSFLEDKVFEFLNVRGGRILLGKTVRYKFYPYTNLGSAIRISSGVLEFKIHSSYRESDSLEAVVELLLCKLLKLPIPKAISERVQKFYELHSKLKSVTNKRKKRIESSESKNAVLKEILSRINEKFLGIDLSDIEIYWGKGSSKTRLGHFDPAHRMIVINPILGRQVVPIFVLEYIVFHELLHVHIPATRKNGKNVIHGREFRALERKYPDYLRANRWLKSKYHQSINL